MEGPCVLTPGSHHPHSLSHSHSLPHSHPHSHSHAQPYSHPRNPSPLGPSAGPHGASSAHEEDESMLASASMLRHLAPKTRPVERNASPPSTLSWRDLELSCQKLDEAHIRIETLDLTCLEAEEGQPEGGSTTPQQEPPRMQAHVGPYSPAGHDLPAAPPSRVPSHRLSSSEERVPSVVSMDSSPAASSVSGWTSHSSSSAFSGGSSATPTALAFHGTPQPEQPSTPRSSPFVGPRPSHSQGYNSGPMKPVGGNNNSLKGSRSQSAKEREGQEPGQKQGQAQSCTFPRVSTAAEPSDMPPSIAETMWDLWEAGGDFNPEEVTDSTSSARASGERPTAQQRGKKKQGFRNFFMKQK